MPGLSDDVWGKIYLAVYCLIGGPVVWLHIRQQRMGKSIQNAERQGAAVIVLYTLAVMWPLILFSMLLNGQFRPKNKPGQSHRENKGVRNEWHLYSPSEVR